ncbi:MAG TPA: RsmE family RNA methyltransferase [Thermoguttaceae bacterium]|nr:RsmE family RNA methyltransferase [Thermoguttaceae bacterium]
MSERYFVAEPIHSDRVCLRGPEAHHLLHVMRARVGDRTLLFNGSGWEFEAELVQATRQEAHLRICRRAYVDRELPVLLVLGVALPKGDRQKWLVEKAVELGVARLTPLLTDRSVAHPGPGMLDRLRRSVIEASKQCGRNVLMQIEGPMSWSEWLSAYPTAQLRWVAHPSGPTAWPESSRLQTPNQLPNGIGLPGLPAIPPGVAPTPPTKPLWAVAVGPEGGWTDAELAAAQSAGWQLLGLGPRILRTETAALTLAALLAAGAAGLLAPESATPPGSPG